MDIDEARAAFRRTKWMAFDLKTTEDEAHRSFQRKHGTTPHIVKRVGPILLAGPIPDKEG